MGADIKSLRLRIKSVGSTMHLTKAMQLVAASKIRRSSEAMAHGRDYAAALTQAVSMLGAAPECAKSPYRQVRDGGRLRLVVIAGDRGLAGGYNANIFRAIRDYQAEHPETDVTVIPIGKRACDRYGDGFASSEHFSADEAGALAKTLCEDFVNGAYDRLTILYTHYESMMTQTPAWQEVLPLQAPEKGGPCVLFEPDELTILRTAVPLYVAGIITACVRESFACEVAARRMAMDSAGKNAQMMIDDLQLAYNRARQGAITQEITEIVAGSGA